MPTTCGQNGSARFLFRVKQPLGGELFLPLLEQRHERARARWLQLLDDDLVARLAGEGRDAAGDDDLKPFLGLELQFRECGAPDHGIDAGGVVLQAEIGVARAVRPAIARDLAAQPHEPERVLDRPLDGR